MVGLPPSEPLYTYEPSASFGSCKSFLAFRAACLIFHACLIKTPPFCWIVTRLATTATANLPSPISG
eukprot:1139102-Pelagomonas_calceolata.AAC.4